MKLGATNHYWVNRGVAVEQLFKLGLSLCMRSDSEVIRSEREEQVVSIRKSVEEKG